MSMKIKTGQTIVLNYNDEILKGVVEYVSKYYFKLSNVVDLETKYEQDGIQYFYFNNVRSIKILTDPTVSNDQNLEQKEISEAKKPPEHINLTTREIEKINFLMQNIKYIDCFGRPYFEAIDHIMDRSVVSVTAEQFLRGRFDTIYLITIATEDAVYIFDIKVFGHVTRHLKEFFESKKPRKVIHNSSRFADVLKFNYNTQLNGVFDTFVLHVQQSGKTERISIIDILKLYFNDSNNFIPTEKNIDWKVRPIKNETRYITAKRTLLLLKLHEFLLHDKMLFNYYSNCMDFSQFYASDPDTFEVGFELSKPLVEAAVKVLEKKI